MLVLVIGINEVFTSVGMMTPLTRLILTKPLTPIWSGNLEINPTKLEFVTEAGRNLELRITEPTELVLIFDAG
jgi:hypothetical protein